MGKWKFSFATLNGGEKPPSASQNRNSFIYCTQNQYRQKLHCYIHHWGFPLQTTTTKIHLLYLVHFIGLHMMCHSKWWLYFIKTMEVELRTCYLQKLNCINTGGFLCFESLGRPLSHFLLPILMPTTSSNTVYRKTPGHFSDSKNVATT